MSSHKKKTKQARYLRQQSTDAEKRLWSRLRDRQFLDAKFRRQYPLGPFIVDFICSKEQLIVELDGGQHAHSVRYDQQRTNYLEVHGYRVLRFWNNDALSNTEGVLEVIRLELESPPHPLGGKAASRPLPLKGARWSKSANSSNSLAPLGERDGVRGCAKRSEGVRKK